MHVHGSWSHGHEIQRQWRITTYVRSLWLLVAVVVLMQAAATCIVRAFSIQEGQEGRGRKQKQLSKLARPACLAGAGWFGLARPPARTRTHEAAGHTVSDQRQLAASRGQCRPALPGFLFPGSGSPRPAVCTCSRCCKREWSGLLGSVA